MQKLKQKAETARDYAKKALTKGEFKRLEETRESAIEEHGKTLGRLRVADEFDGFFWPTHDAVDAWKKLSNSARLRRLEQFSRAMKAQVRSKENSEDSGLTSTSLPPALNVPPVTEMEPAANADDEAGESIEGFIIKHGRPASRDDCPTFRPCPYVSCRYHLYLDVTRRGRLRLNFPDDEIIDLEMSCALDIATNGPKTLEEIGKIMGGISRERVRQIEQAALNGLRARGGRTLLDFLSERAAEQDHSGEDS